VPVDAAFGALAALRPERAHVVHLLEERREVFGLGGGNLFAKLEEAPVVVEPRLVRLGTFFVSFREDAKDGLEESLLVRNEACALRVVFEARDGPSRAFLRGNDRGHDKGYNP